MSSDPKPRRRPARRIRRLLFALVLVAVAGLAGLWTWLESDAAQERVRQWVETRGSELLDREVRVAAFEWNLFPFDAHLFGLEIAGAPGSDQPLLRADSARLQVRAWALISRELRVQSLTVVNPVVHWDAENGPNLALEAGSDNFLSVAIEQLGIINGALEFNHTRWNLDSSLASVNLELQPVDGDDTRQRRAGVLSIGGGGMTIGETAETLVLVGARVPFTVNRNVLTVEGGELTMGNSRLSASGTVRDWQRGEFAITGALDVGDLISLGGVTPPATAGGTVALSANLRFGDAPLSVEGALSSPSLVLAGFESTAVAADLYADSGRVELNNLQLSLFEGALEASISVDLSTRPRSWRLDYEAEGIDLNALSSSPSLPGFRFAGIAASSGSLTWDDPVADTISGAATFDLSLPDGTLDRIAGSAPDPARAAEAVRAGSAGGAPSAEPDTTVTRQRVVPSLPLPLSAHAELDIDRGTVTVRDTTVRLPRTEARITGTMTRAGEVSADVLLDSGDLRLLDRFFTQIRRFRGEQPVPEPVGLAGSAVITTTIRGSITDPRLDGVLEARALWLAGNLVGDIDGVLRLDGSDLEISDLTVRRDGGIGTGEGRLRIGELDPNQADYNVALRLQQFPLNIGLPRLGVPLVVAGEVSGEVSLTGSYNGGPVGEVTLQGDGIQLNDVGELSADILLRLTADEWIAERFELSGPPGRVAVSGGWQRADDTVRAQLDIFDVDATVVGDLVGSTIPLEGLVVAQAQLTGAFSAPDAAATLRWTQARVYDLTLGSVALSAELRGGALAVSALGRSDPDAPAVPPATPTAQGGSVAIPLEDVPTSGWAATFAVDLAEPRQATLRASGDSGLVRAVLAAQGYDLAGDLNLSGDLEAAGTGPLGSWRDWQGSALLSNFTFSRPGLGFALPQPLRLELDGQVLRIDLPELTSEAGTLEASGAIDVNTGRWLDARSTGMVSLGVLEALSEDVIAGGALAINLEASGEVLSGDVAGRLDLLDVTLGREGWPYVGESITGSIEVADGSLRLSDVRGTAGGTPFAVTGQIPMAALGSDDTSDIAAIALTIDRLPLVPLWQKTGRLNELVTGGDASLTVSVAGRGVDWHDYQGSVEIRALRVALTGLELTMPAATTMHLDGDRLEVDSPIILRGPGTDLRVSGAFLLGPFRLDTRLQGSANLDVLNSVTEGWGVAGRSEIDVRVIGRAPALSFTGTVGVESGLLNAPILQPIENISANLTFRDRLIRIDRFVGSLGNTSTAASNVQGSGEIQLVDSVPQRFVLNLAIDEALLRIQPGVRVTASADIQHEGSFDRSILSGTMRISDGEYTRRWEGDEDIFALSESRVVGVDHPLARNVTLDVEVSTPGVVRVVNNVADVELRADLQVRGTLAQPVLLGSMTVLDGTVTFRDQRYRFLRGTAEFQNPLRTEPNFDISIETSIRQYLVTLNASGSPARGDINATFVSSPPLSDLQLIQLLTVGNASDDNARSDDAALGAVGAQATSFLTRQYMNQVERGAQRVFGIDRFRLEPSVITGSGDPTARVTLGKQVTPNLWVSWTTVLGTTEEQLLQVEYQLTRGIRLTATREERGGLGFDIRFDHRFR